MKTSEAKEFPRSFFVRHLAMGCRRRVLVLTVISLICLMSMMGCGDLHESNQGNLVILPIMVKMFFILHNSSLILFPRMARLRVDMSLLVLTVIFLICLMSMMGGKRTASRHGFADWNGLFHPS
jgi:hypothetical protein